MKLISCFEISENNFTLKEIVNYNWLVSALRNNKDISNFTIGEINKAKNTAFNLFENQIITFLEFSEFLDKIHNEVN